jgi:iron transport multicopper oxidase
VTEASQYRCVLTATLGMASVIWYALGGHITEEEMEEEVRARISAKEKKGRFFGLLRRQNL